MHRRMWIAVGAVAAVVLFGGLGTARATQVIRGDQARSSALDLQRRVSHSIAVAAARGVSPRIVADWRRKAGTLAAKPAPTPGILWDASTENFYQNQARAYRRLLRRVRGHLKKVTAAARSRVESDLATIQRLIGNAADLDLDTSAARLGLRNGELALRNAHLLSQFRAIERSLDPIQTYLANAIAARQKVATGILAANGRSVAAISAQADAAASWATDQVALLGVFSDHTASYSATITHLDAAVKAQNDPTMAAVKLVELGAEIANLDQAFQKAVPGQFILVSTEDQWAHVYQNGKLIYSTNVTTGGPELPTGHGIFHIYAKVSPFVFHSPWPPGSPYYYLPSPVSYWMPFDGGEGLHDAPWRSNFGPGSNLAPTNLGDGNTILGSHGCVNLPIDAAQFIWNWSSIGTTVVVI